jgi:hypothetical protein
LRHDGCAPDRLGSVPHSRDKKTKCRGTHEDTGKNRNFSQQKHFRKRYDFIGNFGDNQIYRFFAAPAKGLGRTVCGREAAACLAKDLGD